MISLRYFLLSALFVAMLALGESAASEPRPGSYIRDGESGTLVIRRDSHNKLVFRIESIGGNCHQCGVSGVIRGSVAHADDESEIKSGPQCAIAFSSTASGVDVHPTTEVECRAYCGARAGFDGTYRVPPAACTSAGRQAARDRALRSHRAHRYADAATTLKTLLTDCAPFIGWIEIDQMRNDLALAQYRKGEFTQCLETLSATLGSKVDSVEELRAGGGKVYLPPCDFDNYSGVASATLFNKALCTNGMSPGR